MAGSNPAFDPEVFRSAVRSTMLMGLPNASTERPTFKWSVEREYEIEDPANNPYSWTSTPVVTTTHADVAVPCAVEFAARPAGSTQTTIGQLDTSRAVLTLLDEDFEQVEGADRVVIGGNTYAIDFVAPPLGLFEVTVFQLYVHALDES